MSSCHGKLYSNYQMSALFWWGTGGFDMTKDKNDWFGLHERLSSPALLDQLKQLGLYELAQWQKDIDQDQLTALLSAHLTKILTGAFRDLKQRDKAAFEEALQHLRDGLKTAGHPLASLIDDLPALPFQALTEVQRADAAAIKMPATVRPDLPLSLSALLTGSKDSPSLMGQIEKELASADRADWLVSFIKFSGIRALKSTLQRFVDQPGVDGQPRLRVATTSYLGATDLKAIRTLLEMPNTEVRVSFDTHRTRLHAKAYLFHRKTGFGTAYIGSANISKVALDEGLEWTAKISQYELAYLWRQVIAGFDTHWFDETEFEPISLDDLPRLEEALAAERHQQAGGGNKTWHFLDLRPHAFQQEILDAITDERESGVHKHLVIAATGTGKTMIAAFDYRRFAKTHSETQRPSLLFVAHREEILAQAQSSFRHVLRDETFGDLLVSGKTPTQSRHLFCSVLSWNTRDLNQLPPDQFDYVVLDEAHHASAASYQRILEHIKPKVLLGLTATPERADGQDIREDFGDRYTHEMRLADAIEARHLVPFHYFGIGDHPDVDFSGLAWPRGGYRIGDLDRVIGTNERRAGWVLRQLEDHVANLNIIRALGFCVSKKHAIFMADYFKTKGIAAEALTADSSDDVRQSVRRRLISGELKVVFTVDLFNEGVDIPEIDTVLFLRPTESLTVYLQQLGRGLRLHEGKTHLTVLDFIAPQNRRFRFAERFRALSNRHDQRIDHQLKDGFPWLPAGCLIRLDERASDVVLNNIKDTLLQQRPKIIQALASLYQQKGDGLRLQHMMDWLHFDDPDTLLKHGLPSNLIAEAKGVPLPDLKPYEKSLIRGLRHLLLAEDRDLLAAFLKAVKTGNVPAGADQEMVMLAVSLFYGSTRPNGGWEAGLNFILSHEGLSRDVLDVLQWRLDRLRPAQHQRFPALSGSLALHASYTREQILLALGKGSFTKPFTHREGVLYVEERGVDAFFVTIKKTNKGFSPSTLYEDYAVNQELFHWQSQSTTSPESPTGQRYIQHSELGHQPLLFVRGGQKLSNGLTEPFRYVGPVDYVRHEGSKPMSIVWRLQQPLRARELRVYRQEAM